MKKGELNHLLGIKGLHESQIHTIFETADNFLNLLQAPVKKLLHSETSPLPICSLRIQQELGFLLS